MGNDSILSIFIDESGNFGDPNDPARLCIITFVFHDQATDISDAIRELNRANSDLGLDPEKFQWRCFVRSPSRKVRGRNNTNSCKSRTSFARCA